MLNPEHIPHTEGFGFRARLAGFVEPEKIAQRVFRFIALQLSAVRAEQVSVGLLNEPLPDPINPVVELECELDDGCSLVAIIL